jgi:uncharacterized protein (TIGR02302 family)
MLSQMAGPTDRKLDRKILQARLAMGWERLWAALHWPLLILAGFATAVASGLLPLLPDIARYGALLFFAGAYLWSLKPLFAIVWPGRFAAMRRIEIVTGLAHRPVSALKDTMAGDPEDQAGRIVWEEHKRRQLRGLKNLRAGLPRSAWRDLDPRALRVPLALALFVSLLLGPGDPRANLADALRFAPIAEASPLILDAWIKPPAYTAKPPVMLTSPAMVAKLKTEPEILVPENSVLALRLNGASQPTVRFNALTPQGTGGAELADLSPKNKFEAGLFQSEAKLTRPALVTIIDGERELIAWRISVIPDSPPTAAFTAEPAADAMGALTVKWKADDDYGVARIVSEISLSDTQDGEIGIAGNGVFLFDAPVFPIALRKSAPKHEAGSTSADLTAHPWAGLMVEMVLEARDAAGHSGFSETKTFRLPERNFTKPLARALIEQRRAVVMEPDDTGGAQSMLEALLAYPSGAIERSSTHIAIAAVISRLANARNHDDLREAVGMLWQIAVNLEDGELADIRAELEAARRQLDRALAERASPEEIAKLMQRMREVMDRYMQALLEQAEKQARQGGLNQQRRQQGQTITPEQLQKMLDTIQKLAENGALEAAQELLAQLENMLRNLEPGMTAQQFDPQSDSPMSQMLDQLSDLMRRQQGLMDETQRMPQPGEGEMSERNGREPGNRGQQADPEGLAGRQQDLGRMLEEMLRQLGQNGMQAPPSFGEAGKEMRGAEGSLRQRQRDRALGQQGEALSLLREGAQSVIRQMMQQGMGQEGNYSRNGEARGDQRDPLGRPLPNRNEDFGPERNMLPSELAIRRAREILETLRARAGEPGLERIERDYIDRLLRGLY